MRINNLDLQNFHGFDSRYITFSDRFTALVGDNGAGKTAVLDGLAIVLGSFLSGFKGVKSRHIRKDEIYRKHYVLGGKLDIQLQFPVIVKAQGNIGLTDIEWSRAINGEGGATTSKDAKSVMDYATSLQKSIRAGEEVILPVISYYGTGRLWIQKDERASNLTHNRLDGYSHCLEPASNIKHFTKWFRHMTYIELQEGQPLPAMSAVQKAISSCMQEWDSITFNVRLNELRVKKVDSTVLPFDLLSDGYRNVIGLVADLAHRMAILNPFLGERVCEETSGVVLIDEIDLHLHPSWQKKIVNDLKRTFPKVQFIVTTHSPFIIQSLENGELRRLQSKDDDEVVNSEEFVDRSVEDIAEEVMKVENVQRSDKRIEMYNAAQEYYKLLLKGEKEDSLGVKKIKERLDYLEGLYSADVAYHAYLRMKREIAGLGE